MNQTSDRLNPSDISNSWDSPAERQGSTFHQVKSTVAEKLRTAADTLHERSSQASGRQENLSGYGRQAADWLGRSADYIEEIDPQRVRADLENQVRQHPGRSLLIAGAAGLLLGALLRRR
jgi:ElaB/YqjD/DUF883 family membrane-anchored ribosome-binding protein